MVSKAVQVKGMKLLLIAAVLCGELLMTKCTSLREFRLFPTTGPLQTLGPNPTLFTRLTYSECFIKCSMDPLCTGHSYSPGSGTGRAGSRCWTGHFHPHYFAQEGDEETDLQFWATYSPEQIGLPLGYEVGPDGNWYFRSSIQVTRPAARTICASVPGGELASPRTEDEANALWSYKSDQKTWIGLDYPSGVQVDLTQTNVTGVVFHLDGSLFIHEPYIPAFNLYKGPCFSLTTTGFSKFARSEFCTNKNIYLCQVRVVPP